MFNIKKIPVSQLKPGMYIHEMDISWMQSPFRLHRRKIKTQQEITDLEKSGSRIVSIDIEKSENIPLIETEANSSVELTEQSTEQTTKKTKSVSISEELIVAKRIQSKIQSLVKRLYRDIADNKAIDSKDILPLIDKTVNSLRRNDQALLTLLHMHRQDARLDTHAFGVFSCAILLALKTRKNTQEIETLAMAAILHDCGWSQLPINLFAKAKAYTKAEKKLTEQHIAIAKNSLKVSKGIPQQVIQLILQHHELSNGKGYPEQLMATQLHPLHAILQVTDYYDELIHGLTDHPGMLPANALKNLYQMSREGLFSEKLVSNLVRLLGIYPISSVVKLTSNEIASVTEVNRKFPLLPKITLLLNNKQQPIKPSIVDLANDTKHRLIIEVLDPVSVSSLTKG